eukprot:Skav223777  [mRNA]  locus=scaffold521:223547:224984:+ [translate_table: standard]
MYLKGLALTFVAVHGVDLPDVVGFVTDPVVWLRGQKFHEPLVHQPQKMMPTVDTLADMTPHESEERYHYFMALFCFILLFIIIFGTGVMLIGSHIKAYLGSSYHPLSSSRGGRVERATSQEADAVALDVEQQRALVAIAFTATLMSCTATGVWSLQTGTLSKETGGVAVLIQAIFAVKWLPKGRTFGISAFAEAAFVSLAPFISDAYDTLKDTIFCCLCIQSKFLVLKVIGVLSWLYLAIIHIYFIQRDDTLAELAGCYLPVLSALPKSEVSGVPIPCYERAWNTVLLLLYKQTTPTKQRLLVIENLPQALFSIIFLNLEGGSLFVKVINLGIPVAQIVAAFVLFRPLLNLVGPQLGNKLSAFLGNQDYLKAKQLWEEAGELAFHGDHDLLEKALPKLLEVSLVKDLLKELKQKKVRDHGTSC